MGFFRSAHDIGRGEVAESQLEFPFFAAFMAFCALIVLAVHVFLGNPAITLALTVSMLVFGITVIRVEYGVGILVVAALLSPEIAFTGEPAGPHVVKVRYNDLLIVVIFLGVIVKSAFEGRLAFWRKTSINPAICVYFAICVFSTLLAVRANLPAWDRRTGFFVMLKMAEYYMIFFLVGSAVRDMRTVRRMMFLFLTVAMIVCAYGISMMGTLRRVGAPFESQGAEPNTLGGYLMIVICVSLGLWTQAPRLRTKMMFLALTGAAFIPFLHTLSRASYMSLIPALIALGVVSRKATLLVAVGLTLALSPLLMPETVQERVYQTFHSGRGEQIVIAGRDTGVEVDSSTYERIYIWQKVQYLLTVAPWFGGGLAWENVIDSQYARVIMESGLFGLAAFLCLQFQLLRTSHQASKWAADWFGRGLALGTTACVVGLNIHAFGAISFLIMRIMEPFWILMALVVVIRAHAIEQHTRKVLAQRKAAATPQIKQSSAA